MRVESLEGLEMQKREREDDFKNWKVLNGKSPTMRRVPDYYNRRVKNGSEKKLRSDKEIRLNDRTGFRIFFFLQNYFL